MHCGISKYLSSWNRKEKYFDFKKGQMYGNKGGSRPDRKNDNEILFLYF